MAQLLTRQGQRLLQFGMCLILFSSLDGFAIPYLASQRIGLSVHTLSAFQGMDRIGLHAVDGAWAPDVRSCRACVLELNWRC